MYGHCGMPSVSNQGHSHDSRIVSKCQATNRLYLHLQRIGWHPINCPTKKLEFRKVSGLGDRNVGNNERCTGRAIAITRA